MGDKEIIELFFGRSEQAISELDRKYGKTCYKVSSNILNSRQDAEECVNDAYLGVWNAIPPARPDPLLAFVCKIVRNLSLKAYHRKTAKRRGSVYEVAMEEMQNCLTASDDPETELEARELAQVIEDFLRTLSRRDRVIFMRRYAYVDAYADIAKQVGLSEKNVSVRLTRLRKRLREYLIEKEVLA